MLLLLRPLVKALSRLRRLEIAPERASVVIGDWRITCARDAVEPAPAPELPPRTIDSIGFELPSDPPPAHPVRLATVHQLPARRVA